MIVINDGTALLFDKDESGEFVEGKSFSFNDGVRDIEMNDDYIIISTQNNIKVFSIQ